jgi:hypothetical protein
LNLPIKITSNNCIAMMKLLNRRRLMAIGF